MIRLYKCMSCGKVRIHGKWRHLTPEEEMKLAMERVDWIPREKCLGCYQLVNNSENEK